MTSLVTRSAVSSLERFASATLLVSTFVPSPLSSRVSVGALITIICVPVVIRHIRQQRTAKLVFWSVLGVYAWSLATALGTVTLTDRAFSADYFRDDSYAYLTLAASFTAAYWSAVTNGAIRTGLIIGVAGAISGMLLITPEQAENPWKYVLAWPISILVVAALDRVPAVLGAVALVCLAGVSLTLESRNAAGSLMLAALVLVLLKWRKDGISRKNLVAGGLALAVAAWLAFITLTSMVAAGVFGNELAQRQTTQEGIWLLGGRVEPFVTAGYFVSSPLGIGIGVSPSPEDRSSAERWLADSGAPVNTDYATSRLLGAEVNLHSIVSTFWYTAGLVGLALGIVLLVVLVRGIISAPAHRALVAFVGSQAVWDMLFSPLDANGRWVGFALALVVASGIGAARGPNDAATKLGSD